MDFSKTDTTRYLCAAAYLDKKFRDKVIEQIVTEKYKAIAPSYGVDLLTVIQHCFVAAKREFFRDILLSVLSLLCLASLFTLFLPCYLITYLIVFRYEWITRYGIIAKGLARRNFASIVLNSNSKERINKKIEKIAIEQNSNLIIYGGFSPFVGAGFDIGGWSFALNLKNVREEIGKTLQPIDFEVNELYNYIVHALAKLNLYGLSIEDKLCVNGEEIRDNTTFLPNPLSRPSSQVAPDFIKKFVNTSAYFIRYYKHIKVVSWRGDLVFSVFIRFFKIHEKLFVENSYFLLTPVKNSYRLADAIEPEISFKKIRELLLQTLLTSLLFLVLSPFSLIGKILEILLEKRRQKQQRHIVKETPNFNYGAVYSIRELASSSEYNQYFQKLDKEMYMKIIERQIIDSLVEFLESKNIDTSDLKERKTAIFNNGMIISGGSIKATNLSVGEKATSVLGDFVQSVTPKPSANQPD
ncbi:MAG: hypothetical protein KME30_13095 [Iphinoe sp. HA4291-MV1]|jgi:hypothetical protein|nr:hypothetical protein [Iphinoe sp. HA4291-MV1]